MRTKAAVAERLPIRRGLSEPEAALYIGLGVTKFRELVLKSTMPRPRLIEGIRRWDVDALDAAFKSMPLEGGEEDINEWATVLRR